MARSVVIDNHPNHDSTAFCHQIDKSSKVMVDVEGGNNMMYLPLDRLGDRRGASVNVDQDAVRQATEEIRRELNNANRSVNNRLRGGN